MTAALDVAAALVALVAEETALVVDILTHLLSRSFSCF
jgi:hypothetical protein